MDTSEKKRDDHSYKNTALDFLIYPPLSYILIEVPEWYFAKERLMSEQPEFQKTPISSIRAEDSLIEDRQEPETTIPLEETETEDEGTTQAARNSAPVSEDFEAGVIAQLDSLYRTALRMTNNPQEAMLKAFRFSHTYQPGTNLRAWLFRILNTSAINRYRKNATHPTPSSLPEGEEFYLYNQIRDLSGQELSQGAEEEVLNKYLDEDVYNALNDLPPNFRMAVVLADIEGLSYKEIAEALQIPIGTVMSRISRARRQLQKSLWQYAKERGYVRSEAS
jgi:RNA polymerase sigma-70 factor, ECF subfamily